MASLLMTSDGVLMAHTGWLTWCDTGAYSIPSTKIAVGMGRRL